MPPLSFYHSLCLILSMLVHLLEVPVTGNLLLVWLATSNEPAPLKSYQTMAIEWWMLNGRVKGQRWCWSESSVKCQLSAELPATQTALWVYHVGICFLGIITKMNHCCWEDKIEHLIVQFGPRVDDVKFLDQRKSIGPPRDTRHVFVPRVPN